TQKYHDFDAKKYQGGRVSLGYERLLSKRISLDLSAYHGFTYYENRTGSRAPNGAILFEQYTNYKGWVFSASLRYYLSRSFPGSGVYVGPFSSLGFLQERVFYYNLSPTGLKSLHTLSSEKGKSYGFGALAGYKYCFKHWFAEATLGFIIWGYDDYFNEAISSQKEWSRYYNLNRYEVSVGYSF